MDCDVFGYFKTSGKTNCSNSNKKIDEVFLIGDKIIFNNNDLKKRFVLIMVI